ncbi:hypothetical protein Clacol_005697 [Clathrus columnatus]|uniref:Deacetylase sirtuin-type domain-containing protein n=1 Tax=Clathrus columnatus TaxID=1419009 RepID=A0AAV5AE47_9AGAM|nr:hypothetical protein Clacol_005697 [Clathrus columnatus]
MRLSVPSIPLEILNTVGRAQEISLKAAIERVVNFLTPGNTTVLTGAGVSVDSGIRAYRGNDGRQRYWSRAYMGYQPIHRAWPNPTHYALAALMYTTFIKDIITQNVDGLHAKASSLSVEEEHPQILQLHGSLHNVHCQKYHFEPRARYQYRISVINPKWKQLADDLENSRIQLRTNPDGDIELPGIRFDDFQIPPCEMCLSEGVVETTMKPSVIFFGESISNPARDDSFARIEACDQLLVVGTTLATYSAFRLVKHALELNKPVLLLNHGPTRADKLAGVDKIEMHSGQVLHAVAELLTAGIGDEEVDRMLSSGIVTPVPPE